MMDNLNLQMKLKLPQPLKSQPYNQPRKKRHHDGDNYHTPTSQQQQQKSESGASCCSSGSRNNNNIYNNSNNEGCCDNVQCFNDNNNCYYNYYNEDTLIFLASLFIREFLSNFCTLVLSSRIGKDIFIAGPLVSLYMIIVFRRPLNNPYILTMACLSAGDWGKANVSGYPGFDKKKTGGLKLFLFWAWMLAAQLLGASFAANFRADNDAIFGSEFVNGAAWGSGQLYLRANLSNSETCWNKNFSAFVVDATTNPAQIINIPTRFVKSQGDMILNSCKSYIRIRWWFMEELVAVLFLIVGYVHIWRWLRWQDMKDSTANEQNDRYWRNLVAFAVASAALGLMTTLAFPTAHYGAHTSLFLSVYQSRNEEKAVTANFMNEPVIRVVGGSIGCILAVVYERVITWVDEVEEGVADLDDPQVGGEYSITLLAHKILYISDVHKKKKTDAGIINKNEEKVDDPFFRH